MKNQEDHIIKQFFKAGYQPDDVRSDDFNRKVMDKVMNEWVSQSNYYEPLVDKRNRWWIVPGVIVIFIIGFLFDVNQMGTKGSQPEWIEGIALAFKATYSWIEPIHLLLIGVSLATGLLLMLDRMFQKLSNI